MVPDVGAFRTGDVLKGLQTMPAGSFLAHLPPELWPLLVGFWGPVSRVYQREDSLPIGPRDSDVHIVLGGCVRQDRFPFGTGGSPDDGGDGKDPRITRFRGVGQLLGEAKLIEEHAAVRTTCLTTTWVMSCSATRMMAFLTRHPHSERALLRSLEDRNRDDEMVYGTATRTPVERVGGLLAHLARVAGTTDPERPGHISVLGLSQRDIAEALLLGVSTVETAIRRLRTPAKGSGLPPGGVLRSKYRQFVVTDLPALQHLTGVR
ncbi:MULTISPECIES: Crp/Fnr family transcriptional regulator [Streptomyces]|uniref:Crp/Fnr family transcriptional regulator n=1 Tax=Streptomyces doudnae TaxID=3075536 RepID=A0ABD5EZD8_9ACTN|nr:MULTISPECIES: Crp/Fnr family transcriptional regulator [unclassified Streptomyces]MDT0439593.1 Crp/Fnr family transcriptional regulator [Streptomyces sp. DSM 41981]MYQ67568.1 Crp/Fnr family transcriptional regulator [Streptomyces sp. SID4950]SCE36882.1 cAMP-binding domain of CRP or a regulatory subunit of cAMP-dependent protein kinases [Streptomyces sp. SolWspMP-5a-2]